MKEASLRIIIDLILLVSIFVLPWWVTIIAAVVFIFFFKIFLESIVLALIIDILYAPDYFIFGAYFLTLFVLVVFVGFQIIRKKLIFY